ncbi:hypothetical protein YC2023_066358 [Brassica napus]
MNATWLILPVVICLSQRLTHAYDPLEGKSGASSRGNSSSNSLVVEPWDGSPGPPSVRTGRLVSSVSDMLQALTGWVVPPVLSHMLVTSYLLQLLVAFFMGRKSSAACALCAEACLHLSSLRFALCGSKPSSEVTLYALKHLLLSSGRPVTARKTRKKFREKERKKREKSVRKTS